MVVSVHRALLLCVPSDGQVLAVKGQPMVVVMALPKVAARPLNVFGTDVWVVGTRHLLTDRHCWWLWREG